MTDGVVPHGGSSGLICGHGSPSIESPLGTIVPHELRDRAGSNSGPVYFVDPDAGFRDGLAQVFARVGLAVRCFDTPADFLEGWPGDDQGCLVTEVCLPAMSGLELQRALTLRGSVLPVVFLARDADIATAVDAMKAGAVDFLVKPVHPPRLLLLVQETIRRAQVIARRNACLRAVLHRFGRLTGREREVMEHMAAGAGIKQTARRLAISPKTVEMHRGRVLHKLGVDSAAQVALLWHIAHCRCRGQALSACPLFG